LPAFRPGPHIPVAHPPKWEEEATVKKLLILLLIAGAAFFFWNRSQQGGDGPLADLQHRLDAAEQRYQQAGRAAGASGVDTSADAASALREVEQVERELQALEPSAQRDQLQTRARDLKQKMG
jgi:hypothetical protein